MRIRSELSGCRAIVTGAAHGIGRKIAVTLARYGASLSLLDVPAEETALQEVATRVQRTRVGGPAVLTTLADLAHPRTAGDLVQKTVESFGGIELLVNNAATWSGKPYWHSQNPLLESTPDEWTRVFAVNLVGTLSLTRLVARQMLGQPALADGLRGSIVQISSIHDSEVRLHHIEYSLSKAALSMSVKELAVLLAPHGIRVNGIAPGDILVRPNEAVDAGTPAENPYVPLGGRTGLPADVAQLVLFLANHNQSGYMTGTVIPLDGGLRLYNHIVQDLKPGSGTLGGSREALREGQRATNA